MSFRSLHFMNQSATILRATTAVDVTNIRDRIVTGYSTIQSDAPIYLEPEGSDVVFNEQLGSIAIDSFSGYLPRGTDIAVNDVVMIDSVTYEVRGVLDYGRQGFHIKVAMVRKNFQRA